jgi:alpha-beta hydrolase superfamily lysophospholipase
MAIVGAMFKELSLVNLEPRLPRARTPMLLIAGGRDGIVLPRSVKPGFDAWGGPKEFSLFEDSGHLPYVDSTDRFVALVVEFLRENTDAGRAYCLLSGADHRLDESSVMVKKIRSPSLAKSSR